MPYPLPEQPATVGGARVRLLPPPGCPGLEQWVLPMEFGRWPSKVFIHPVVRAFGLHFWLANDHPFCDGNGRTARSLFYWAMLNQGY